MSKLYEAVDQQQLLEDADSCLLHYGTSFHPDIITNAEGQTITTASGHRMLDWTSGQMSTLVGHANPEIVETIHNHAKNLDHLFSGMLSPPVISLAKRLTSLTPSGLDKAFFLSTGGESNEAAIRLAKFYTGKFEIVGLASSWHGVTSGAIAAQYHAGRAGYGPNMPGNLALPTPNAYRSIFRHADGSYDWQTELNYGFELIDKQSCGSLAALILEPILSSGGMLVLPPGYLKAVKQHCERRGMLLIIDEAQTGIGRAGDMFAFQHFAEDEGVVPDILTLSKTLGNGLPLSAVVTSNRIADFAKDNHFLFYTTHINDPLPASVGDKVLEIVVRDNLVDRSRILGQKFQQRLQQIQSRYGCVGDVRGRGLMAGVEIVADRKTKVGNTELGAAVATKMTELGLWAQLSTMPSFGGVFRLAPPLTTTDDELETGLRIIEEAFASTPGTLPLYATSQGFSASSPVEARL
ncbi:2,2-dialkylglycine decarboxylase [Pseudocercospora fuligena]|uniref:2,2-dialkylglycine decarboxylase n=1 Tax=Pseudocercospora fuligena TaxID=685502 RepID=A0A8H6VI59_9PEZI|nr:2,2-dialkylglycine decarboxylase [Pseudocercospora fuligena]